MKTAQEHLKNYPMNHLPSDIKEIIYAAWTNGYSAGVVDAKNSLSKTTTK